ncbi:type I toxin-antitoxin system ptaRNA1 family toxin, partial [Enterobacter hormaechei subsp. steigerwaltii]|nr:type I toxin-antitoxin system ptaRNA1 family toxin [Enterobacter hormaechei subsp. steigerwaltii]
MATQYTTQATQTVQHAATLLAGLDWIDQDMARQLSPMAEAVANMFTLVYY